MTTAKLDPLDLDSAPGTPNSAKVARIYLAQRFAPVRCATQLPNDLGPVSLPFIQCRATGAGSDGGFVTITNDLIDVDIYAVNEEAAAALAGQVRFDLSVRAPGTTLDRSTITRCVTVAAPAVRPYINTSLVRVGATYALGLHTRTH